jgi:hypothetical protein
MRELNDEWVEAAVLLTDQGERIRGTLVATPHRLRFDTHRPEHKSFNLDANLQNVKKAQLMPHEKKAHEDETALRVNIFDPPTNVFRLFAVNKFRIDQFFRVLSKWQVACQFAATKQHLNLITTERKHAAGMGSPSLMRKPSYADSLVLPSSSVHPHRHVTNDAPAWIDLSMTSFLDKSNLLKEESMRKVLSFVLSSLFVCAFSLLFATF